LETTVESHRHFILYKPYGYLSQLVNRQNKRRNKNLLGDLFDFPEGTMAVGRLDEKSEGLLIMTTNGKLSALIRGRKVEKEYAVQVDGLITESALQALREGVEISINGKLYETLPCEAVSLDSAPDHLDPEVRERDERHGPTSWLSITLREGKFRQIRKMTAAVGFPTLRLLRTRIAGESLGNLEPGAVREVSTIKL
jgi:23S rRNA pseudouridine2457 synthase